MMSFIINTVSRGNVGFASFSFPFRVLRQRDNCNNCNEKKEESPEVFGLQLSAPPIALGGMRHSTPAREGAETEADTQTAVGTFGAGGLFLIWRNTITGVFAINSRISLFSMNWIPCGCVESRMTLGNKPMVDHSNRPFYFFYEM